MANLFLIISFKSSMQKEFLPSLLDKAKGENLALILPRFGQEEIPSYRSWCEIMDDFLVSGELNSQSIIVSDQIGSSFILKYLSQRNISIQAILNCEDYFSKCNQIEISNIRGNEFQLTEEELEKAIPLVEQRYIIETTQTDLNTSFAKTIQANILTENDLTLQEIIFKNENLKKLLHYLKSKKDTIK